LWFNANSAIFQLYHGENKLIVNEMMMRTTLFHENSVLNVSTDQLTTMDRDNQFQSRYHTRESDSSFF